MSRLEDALARTGRTALVAFTVAGDPDFERSVRIATTLAAAGADVIELGMPFSDPTADGPVIERADGRALGAGMTPDRLFDLIRRVRSECTTPIVLLCYFNVLHRYGVDRFCRAAADAGLDGLLCVDLPLEQSEELQPACRAAGLDRILMAAPATGDRRLARIGQEAEGFVYVVSTAGVTGVRDRVPETVAPLLARLRRVTALPLAVGFGISTPEQAGTVAAAGADGVIVGSAIAELIEAYLHDDASLFASLRHYVGSLRQVLEQGAR
jgi:tryptophan synthase alpha chain